MFSDTTHSEELKKHQQVLQAAVNHFIASSEPETVTLKELLGDRYGEVEYPKALGKAFKRAVDCNQFPGIRALHWRNWRRQRNETEYERV